MQTYATTLFISDLHLDEKSPQTTELFLNLLKQNNPQKNNTQALYILGDLFEVWIGDDDLSSYHKKIINALRESAEAGLAIYFLHGNRDFLIGKAFAKATHCQLLAEETVINLYGTKVLLMHGDTLCTKDIAYLRARKIAYNYFVQTIFLWLPLSWRQKIANRLRNKSVRHTTTTAYEVMDVTQHAVEEKMHHHGVQFLIHGHTHRPAVHEFTIDQSQVARIVLGSWHESGSVLAWDETGKKALLTLPY